MTGLTDQLRRLGEFLLTDFRRMLAWSAALLLIAAAVGWLTAGFYPEETQRILEQFIDMLAQSGVVEESGALSPLPLMANNWRAMLLTALYGFMPFLPMSAAALGGNGFLLGLMGGWYQVNGISIAAYFAGVLPHGVLELGALALSTACGLALCRNMTRWIMGSSRRMPMLQLLEDLLRVLLLMVFPMTAAAALIETYITPIVMGWFL